MHDMDPGNQASGTGRIVKNFEKWRTYCGPRQLAALESLAGKVLANLGYPLDQFGYANLNAWELRFLRIGDRVARSRAFFRDNGARASPRYLRALAASRKQWSVSCY